MSGIQSKITRQPMKTGAADKKPRAKINNGKRLSFDLHIAVIRHFMCKHIHENTVKLEDINSSCLEST